MQGEREWRGGAVFKQQVEQSHGFFKFKIKNAKLKMVRPLLDSSQFILLEGGKM